MAEAGETLKVYGLKAENFKRLKLVDIRVDDAENVIEISGKNEAGKSSFLDIIEVVLDGRARAELIEPIRRGAKKAYAQVDMGKYVATVNWTSNEKSYLKVSTRDGAKYDSPATLLESFLGDFSFDPHEFAGLPEKEQIKIFSRMVGVDLNEYEKQRKQVYDDRALVNKEVKKLEGQVAGIPAMEDVPAEPVSVAFLLGELNEAEQEQKEHESRREYLRGVHRNIGTSREEINQRGLQIQRLQVEQELAEAELQKLLTHYGEEEKQIAVLSDPNIAAIKSRIQDAEGINQRVRQQQERVRLEAELKAEREKSEGLTEKIKEIDAQKRLAIEAAKLPIEELGFDENGVTYQSIPFGQVADSQKLRVSTAIAMALNPTLRVIRIRNWNLLDNSRRQMVRDMAREKGYQIWAELVSDKPGEFGFYIEDGEVRRVGVAGPAADGAEEEGADGDE